MNAFKVLFIHIFIIPKAFKVFSEIYSFHSLHLNAIIALKEIQ